MKANKTMKGYAIANHRRVPDKESESNTDSTADKQTFNNNKK
jgi:hypothetical protein